MGFSEVFAVLYCGFDMYLLAGYRRFWDAVGHLTDVTSRAAHCGLRNMFVSSAPWDMSQSASFVCLFVLTVKSPED